MIRGVEKVTQQKIGRIGIRLLMIFMDRYSAAELSETSLAKAVAVESWVIQPRTGDLRAILNPV